MLGVSEGVGARLKVFERLWQRLASGLVFLAALVPMLNQSGIREFWPDAFPLLDIARWLPSLILALMALLCFAFSRHCVRGLKRFDALFIAFVALAYLSAVYSIEPTTTFARTSSLLIFYAAIFGAAWALSDKRGEEVVVRNLLTCGFVVFGLSLVALLYPSWSFPYYLRFQGVMGNPNALGLLVALVLPLAFWAAIERRQRRYWLLIAVMLLDLILSQSRLELLTTSVGTAYYLFNAVLNRRHAVVIAIGGLVILNIILTQFSFVLLTGSPRTPGDYSVNSWVAQWQDNPRNIEWASGSGRFVAWQYGVQYLAERPLTGFGFGTEDQIYVYHGVRPGSTPFSGLYFHNSYLGLALQVGILGALIFFAPLLKLAVAELRHNGAYSENPLRFALRGVLLAGLASALFESWLYSMGNAFAFPFWTCVMLLARFHVSRPSAS